MSYWYEPTIEDIDFSDDKEEMHVYLDSDEFGNNYCSLKVKDIIEILKKEKLISVDNLENKQ